MNDSPSMNVDKSLKELRHDRDCYWLVGCFSYDAFEKFSSFAELEYKYIVMLMIVDFE